MNRVERLTAILLLLQEHPRTAGQIAERFEVSRRTVLRDVQALCEMGVPVSAREGPGGGYALPDSYSLDPLALTSNEAFLLLMAIQSLHQLSDAPFSAERATLALKLRALLPPSDLPALEKLVDKVGFHLPSRDRRAPHLEGLLRAIQHNRWARLTYQSAERRSQVHCLPRALTSENGYWYCRAFVHERQQEQTYRVDRIVELAEPEPEFAPGPPPPETPYEHPSHPQIQAELSPRGARLLEVEPHIAKHIQSPPSGPAWITFRCPPSELDYFARLFAGMGSEIHVYAPEELCQRMAAIGQVLVARYAAEKPEMTR